MLWPPPPTLTISNWADCNRVLSPEASAEPGRWRTARVPYTREIMDCIGRSRETVLMGGSQAAKTEICLNAVGYYMSQDPAPSMLVEPTIDMAEAISKDRIAPMLRDTPILQGLVREKRAKDSENTILHKSFPGGQLTISGANSPASLRSRPIRFMLLDEIDGYPASAGPDGDPVTLAVKRTMTFWNRRIFYVSTPTIKGSSRIEKLWEKSDKRYYLVPCPHCGHEQRLVWERLKWQEAKDSDRVKAWYECEKCEGKITDAHKPKMLAAGRWQVTEPKNSIPGFHIWEAYSPWVKFGEIVEAYLKAKDDVNQLQVFWNTSLGLPFEHESSSLQWRNLLARSEPYRPLSVPRGALLLTAGVDVQDNRLAVSIWGWGRGEEAWLVYHCELYGNPREDQVWAELDAMLSATYTHELGELAISATAIDTGYLAQEVYQFVRKRARCYACKGSSAAGRPVVGRPSLQEIKGTNGKPLKKGISLWTVGTDTVKSAIYGRLRLTEPKAGYFHFYQGLEDEYFEQLCAEKVQTRFVKGFPRREWVKTRSRNEALDCLVYAYTAAHIAGLPRIDWDKLESQLFPPPEEEKRKEVPPPAPKKRPWIDRSEDRYERGRKPWIERD